MGLLSDLFSGKKKREQAVDRLKNKMLTLTLVGASLLSPMKAFSQTADKDPVDTVKTELVQDTVATPKAEPIKFKDHRLQKAADRMMKTKTGRQVLEEMQALKIGVEISNQVSADLGGYYAQGQRKILINSSCSDDLIASILVHEGTHARQACKGCYLTPAFTMQTYFSMNKAMEADAMKNQVFAAYELKELGDASVFNAFKRDRPKLANAFLSLREKYADQPDVLAKETMLAYYQDYTYIKTYEDRYVKAMDTFNDLVKPGQAAGAFQQRLSEAEIIKRVCQLGGEHYMQAADSVRLQGSECNYIQKSTFKSLSKIAESFAKKVSTDPFNKPDNSYLKFYVVDGKGRVLENPKVDQPKTDQQDTVKDPANIPLQKDQQQKEQAPNQTRRMRRARRREEELPTLAKLSRKAGGR